MSTNLFIESISTFLHPKSMLVNDVCLAIFEGNTASLAGGYEQISSKADYLFILR